MRVPLPRTGSQAARVNGAIVRPLRSQSGTDPGDFAVGAIRNKGSE